MVKHYILDTNILIHCPDSILKFDEHNVYITHITLEELDKLKTTPGETGYNARESIRIIKRLLKISTKKNTKLGATNSAETPGGGSFRIYTTSTLEYSSLPDGWDKNKPDNKILLMVKALEKKYKNVILVSNDIAMLVKADAMDINAQEYRNDRASATEELYTGRKICHISDDDMLTFKNTGEIKIDEKLEENQFVVLLSESGNGLGEYRNGHVHQLKYRDRRPFGVSPRNVGQYFAQEALLSPCDETPLVILKGPAGTSKTFYSLACGLQQVVEENIYKRVLICRPNVKFDDDIGYLKGTEMDKILPLIRPCLDNLEELLIGKEKGKKVYKDDAMYDEAQNAIEELFERGWLKAEALAYLRGRSITDTFIIIDEAQNASPNQMLGIITRAGRGSKICIIGDIEQVDNPRLDAYNNGLTFASERMKGSSLVKQLSFTDEECTRSLLAKEAADRLEQK